MSKEEKKQGAPAQPKAKKQNDVPNNVIALQPNRCLAADCKSKPQKADFCQEHYDWFKFGLITKNGERAKDFDKKLVEYQKFSASKAA